MRAILTSALTIVLLAACSGGEGVNPGGGQDPLGRIVSNPFELSVGETVTVQTEGVSVTFTDILEDSRCPLDVECFWEGRIIIGLEVVDLPSDTFFVPVTLNPLTLGPIPPPKDTLGFRFSLLAVTPYPISTDSIALSDYRARLAVFRLDDIQTVDGEVQILNNPPSPGDAFDIASVVVTDDILTASIRHGGGCGDHDYELYFSPPGFMESLPAQATLLLRHVDLNDPCDALVEHDASFDLRPLAQFYEMMFGRRDCMILNITDALAGRTDTSTVAAWYYPTGMSNSAPCTLRDE